MDINLIFDEIIIGNNTLSEEGREEIVVELIDIYSKMPQPVKGVGVVTFINLSDKDLVLTMISAYEAFAIKHFLFCGVEPSKVEY
jgi:hypothetical protein